MQQFTVQRLRGGYAIVWRDEDGSEGATDSRLPIAPQRKRRQGIGGGAKPTQRERLAG
jgi:hypothetical protein